MNEDCHVSPTLVFEYPTNVHDVCGVVHQVLRSSPCLSAASTTVPRRHFSIHEYQAMDLLRNYDIAVPMYKVATDPTEAREIAVEFGMHCIYQLRITII